MHQGESLDYEYSQLEHLEKVPTIKGWDFSKNEILDAIKNKTLLQLDTETSNVCNLRCEYCFRDEHEEWHKKLENELSFEERKNLVKEAKELGCKSIKLVGAGEPLVDDLFWEHIRSIQEESIIPIVYTNGTHISPDVADLLYNLNASVIIKKNSIDPSIEHEFVGVEDYFHKRENSLQNLIDAGFTKEESTRLGLDAIITVKNHHEIEPLFRFCRENNIFPHFKSFIPCGGSLNLPHWEVSKNKLIKLFNKIKTIDNEEYGFETESILPYVGGFPCFNWHCALYVNILGDVYICPGSRDSLGNIRNGSLTSIWLSDAVEKLRSTPYVGCPPREQRWKLATK